MVRERGCYRLGQRMWLAMDTKDEEDVGRVWTYLEEREIDL